MCNIARWKNTLMICWVDALLLISTKILNIYLVQLRVGKFYFRNILLPESRWWLRFSPWFFRWYTLSKSARLMPVSSPSSTSPSVWCTVLTGEIMGSMLSFQEWQDLGVISINPLGGKRAPKLVYSVLRMELLNLSETTPCYERKIYWRTYWCIQSLLNLIRIGYESNQPGSK